MKKLTTIFFVVCCFLLCSSVVIAQYDKWHFGNNAFLPVNPDHPRSGCFSTQEGCAVYGTDIYSVEDKEYYSLVTDGVTLFDQQCRPVLNGTGLMGHGSSTQSAVITPYPGDTSRYIVFTAGAGLYVENNNIGIRYSVVDFNPTPEVIQKNVLLLDTATEKLVATLHCNNQDFWVVAHGWGDNKFYAWLVNSSGVASKPVVSAIGAVHERINAEYVIGHMKISPNGRKLVVVTNTMKTVQLFDFDNSTGVVSNPVNLPSSVVAFYGDYGASFSPNNDRLYISSITSQKRIQLAQFTVTGTPEQIVASQQIIFSTAIAAGDNIGALQLAPVHYNHRIVGRIYCARSNSQYLGVIMEPDREGSACNYIHDGYDLGVIGSTFGLPNCIDEHFNTGVSCYKPRAQTEEVPQVVCAGESIDFYDASMNKPTSWKWLFPGGVPASSTQRDPKGIRYDKEGIYNVILIVTNGNGSDTLIMANNVTVLQRPVANAGADVTICRGESIQLLASGGGSYQWQPSIGLSNSQIASPIASPKETTKYIVKVTDGEGLCEDSDTVLVTVIDKPVAVGGEYIVCKGDTIWHDAGGGIEDKYRWEPATGVSDPAARMPVIVVAQTMQYKVIITGKNGCVDTADVRVSVVLKPKIDAGDNVVICRGSTVTLKASGSPGRYVWEPRTGLSDYTSRTPEAAPETTTTYRVTVFYESGCHNDDTVLVTVLDKPVAVGGEYVVCKDDTVWHDAGTGGMEGTYRWEPVMGVSDPAARMPAIVATQTTLYKAIVTGKNGCADTADVLVDVLPKPEIDAGENIAICRGSSVTLKVSGSPGSCVWEPRTGLSNYTSRTPEATPETTTTYRITVLGANGCRTTDSVTVAVDDYMRVNAGDDRIICRGDRVQLHAVSPTTIYRWEPADGLDNPVSATPVASPTVTTTYQVTALGADGCTGVDEVTITVLPRPVLNAGSDYELCEGTSIVIALQGSEGEITWKPSVGVSDPHSRAPVVAPQTTTVYTVTLTNAGNCSTTASIRVVVLPKPIMTVGRDTAVCRGRECILRATAGSGTYRWEPAEAVEFPNRSVSLARPQKTTMYTVTYTDKLGCAVTDSIKVQVAEPIDAQVILPQIDGPVGKQDFHIPVTLRVGDVPLPASASLNFTLQYNTNTIEWTSISNGTMVKNPVKGENGMLTVTIENIAPAAGETVIAELVGTLLLAKEDYTVLDIDQLVMTPSLPCVSVSGTDGLVRIGGVCFGRNIRRFDFLHIDMVPNPASDILEVRIHNTTGGAPSVQFLTLWGESVPAHLASLQGPTIAAETGDRTTVFDVSSLANGVYYVAVEVDGYRVVQPLIIMR